MIWVHWKAQSMVPRNGILPLLGAKMLHVIERVISIRGRTYITCWTLLTMRYLRSAMSNKHTLIPSALAPKATVSHNAPSLPEWLRVNEACEFSRLSKAKLYDLFNRGLVKSVSLRERGMVRGTRLVSSDSLRVFLESRSSGGECTGV